MKDFDLIEQRALELGIRFADCGLCGNYRSVQGTFAGVDLCVPCADGSRQCHECNEVKPIGLSTKTEELCFDCLKEVLRLGGSIS